MVNAFRRIAFFGSQITVGGAQHVLLDQASWFHSHGYAVNVVFFYDKDGLLEQWQSTYPFPISTLSNYSRSKGLLGNLSSLLKGFGKLRAFLKQNEIEVIECFTHDADLIGIPAAFFAGVRCRVGTHHGQFASMSKLVGKLHTAVMNSRMASKLVCVSARAEKQALSEGVKAEKLCVIWNGIEPISPDAELREKTRTALGVKNDEKLLLSVGRLTPEKAQDLMIRAAKTVCAKLPQARFFLAGDGPLRGELTSLVDELELKEEFTLLGNRNDVPALLNAADLFILYSQTEGMPVSAMEAMSAELPVVASSLEGIAQLIPEPKYGTLLPPGNADELAQTLLDLLADEKKMKDTGKNARERIIETFSLDASCKKYLELFETFC